MDSRYLVDLNDFDENELFFADNQRASEVYGNPTYGDMKNYALVLQTLTKIIRMG